MDGWLAVGYMDGWMDGLVWIALWFSTILLVLSVPHLYSNSDVIMGAMASQITSLTIVCSTVYSGADQRKYQSSASLAFVMGIHRWPVNSPHKGPVTRKMFPFDDVIMYVTPTRSPLYLQTPQHQQTQRKLPIRCFLLRVPVYHWLCTVSSDPRFWSHDAIQNGRRDLEKSRRTWES